MCCYHRMTQAHMGQDEEKKWPFRHVASHWRKAETFNTLTGNDLLG